MADTVFKKLQLVGTSTKSFSDAAANAIAKAAAVRGQPELVRGRRAARQHLRRQDPPVPGDGQRGRQDGVTLTRARTGCPASPGHGGLRTVAAVEHGVVRQVVELRADAGRQGLEIAVREIRAPNAAAKITSPTKAATGLWSFRR